MQTDLPIWDLHDDLRAAWRAHNRFVLVAPTGSGKTTQVCQMLAQDGRVPAGKQIVILQPRRVAARTVARRVAEEMGVEVGGQVGYQVRFDEALGPDTRIAFVTEGILLRWLHSDPALARAGAILFDEFHERSLLGDVALAIARRLQAESRPDLLIGVMSATLDAGPVAGYLGGCPILESRGRAFPVDVRYAEWSDDQAAVERAAQAVADIVRQSPAGDILVFMPGAYEIARTLEEIRHGLDRESRDRVIVLPLHGELPPQEQDRAFIPGPCRRVIVATNVAETSVTLPGIRFVVDSGLARIARYDPERAVDTLPVEPISRASADQRAGRAGRTGPGMCYRLWAEADHAARPERNTPEIQRVDLAEAVLLLRGLGRAGIAEGDFLDPPEPGRVRQAEELLALLGAIDRPGGAITGLGRRMLRLPVHPRYARMLIEAEQRGCAREAALLAALVGGRDLLTRLDRNDRITRRNRQPFYVSPESDFHVLAQAFEFAAQNRFNAKACYSHGINPHAAREVALAYQQILGECRIGEAGPPHPAGDDIQRCHLAGFVDHLAVRKSSGADEFDLAGGRQATLMDESAVRRSLLIVASDIRDIVTRSGQPLTLIGLASAVKPEWLRDLNPPGLGERVEHVYDRLNKRVAAGRVLRYQDLVVGGEPVAEVDPAEAARVLAAEFAGQAARLPQWNHEVTQWLLRTQLVAALAPETGVPPLGLAHVEQALAQAWHGATSYKEAAGRPLLPAFQAMLTPEQRAAVEQLAPAGIEIAPGRPARLVYTAGGPPEATVKAEEVRDLAQPPAVVAGRQPVRLKITGADHRVAAVSDGGTIRRQVH